MLPTDHLVWVRFDSLERSEQEWLELSEGALGTVLIGDFNVHRERWLTYSNTTQPEGRKLYSWCWAYSFEERVRKPTRGPHLLDLVLTDLGCGRAV